MRINNIKIFLWAKFFSIFRGLHLRRVRALDRRRKGKIDGNNKTFFYFVFHCDARVEGQFLDLGPAVNPPASLRRNPLRYRFLNYVDQR
jgi:hypothetical protein